jgi:hypothetical protein
LTPTPLPTPLRPSPLPPTATRKPQPSPSPSPVTRGPSGFPADVDSLTGLRVESPALLERRPVALEIANFPVKVRPQAGLSLADLVFEHAVGQGVTRFLAVYYGQDATRAGPVTSGQWVSGQLTRLYAGVLGVQGAIPSVDDSLQKWLPQRLFTAGPGLCPGLCPEGPGIASPVFGDTQALSRYASQLANGGRRPNLDGLVFNGLAPDGGAAANRLEVVYASLNLAEWTFDPEAAGYLRSQDRADGKLVPATDQLTGQPLIFENVIVLFAGHRAVQPNLLDISLWLERGRPMVLLRSGRIYQGTWEAPSLDAPLQWVGDNGGPLALAPGRTWVEIVGLSSVLESPAEGVWRVVFSR